MWIASARPPRSLGTPSGRLVRAAGVLLIGCLLPNVGTDPADAQEALEVRSRSAPAIRLYGEVLGSYSWPVTTRDPRAQEYFDQGARLMFSYATQQAQLSFAEAARIDSTCAMCWWGEAWAMGPYFNGGFSVSNSSRVQEILRQARSFAESATPVEQALIDAMEVRHGVRPPGTGGSRLALDSAYAGVMENVHARFPQNAEVSTLYADALMLLEPRRGVWPADKPSVQLIHRVLEGVLHDDPRHPGACHAYVHATETTPKVVEAQRCADFLGSAIPGASHINHMPSHTYNRVGRWGDATRANVEAWETDQRAEEGHGIAIYPSHNLHMLLFSAAMDGQSELALEAARAYGQYDGPGSIGFQSLLLARFGRFAEALELPHASSALLHRGYWHFGQGMAHLRLGRPERAAQHLAQLDSITANARPENRFRVHSASDLLEIVSGLLRGELLRTRGEADEAIAALQDAAAREDELMYDEPEPLPLLARDYLGAALLEAGRAAEAEAVYRAALRQRPNNGWSFTGLEQALRAQSRTAEADEVAQQLQRSWERADLALTSSRF